MIIPSQSATGLPDLCTVSKGRLHVERKNAPKTFQNF